MITLKKSLFAKIYVTAVILTAVTLLCVAAFSFEGATVTQKMIRCFAGALPYALTIYAAHLSCTDDDYSTSVLLEVGAIIVGVSAFIGWFAFYLVT